jgi:FkbM family methyltransferase
MFYPPVNLHHLGALPSWVYREIFVNNCYGFSNISTPVLSIVDLGANIGLSALYFASRYPEAKILSVEPNPDALRCLRHNTAHCSRIEIWPGAIVEKSQHVILWIDRCSASRLNSSVVGRDMRGRENEFDSIQVEGITLAAIMPPQVDILKVDIEGAEYQVLKSPCVHPSNVHSIVVEFHDLPMRRADFEEIYKLLIDRGFSCIDPVPKEPLPVCAIMRFECHK